MKALLLLGLLFSVLTAIIAVLVVGSRRKWSLIRIGGVEFLVMAVANIALIAGGNTTTLTTLGAIGCAAAGTAMLMRERFLGTTSPIDHVAVNAAAPDSELGQLGDGELVAYTERLSQIVAKRSRGFAAFPLLMLPVLPLIFLGDRFGVPPFVPIVLLLVALLGAVFPIARVWRSDMYRSEAVLELDRRGLPRPQGTERVTAATVALYRRGGLPTALMAATLVLMLPLMAVMLSDPANESGLLIAALFALVAAMFASLIWLLSVLLGAARRAQH